MKKEAMTMVIPKYRGRAYLGEVTFKLGKDGVVARATGDTHEGTTTEKTSKICGLISSMSPVALKQRRIMLL